MGVKVTGLSAINNKLSKLPNVEKSVLDKIGAYAVQAIIDRTHKGTDVDGRKFKRYKTSQLNKRLDAGRGGSVDLNFKGNMLAAMRYRKTSESVVIYFGAKDEMLKAHGHHFGNPKKGVPRRRFFGLSRKEKKRVLRMLERA